MAEESGEGNSGLPGLHPPNEDELAERRVRSEALTSSITDRTLPVYEDLSHIAIEHVQAGTAEPVGFLGRGGYRVSYPKRGEPRREDEPSWELRFKDERGTIVLSSFHLDHMRAGAKYFELDLGFTASRKIAKATLRFDSRGENAFTVLGLVRKNPGLAQRLQEIAGFGESITLVSPERRARLEESLRRGAQAGLHNRYLDADNLHEVPEGTYELTFTGLDTREVSEEAPKLTVSIRRGSTSSITGEYSYFPENNRFVTKDQGKSIKSEDFVDLLTGVLHFSKSA